jgi:hypothetical protein
MALPDGRETIGERLVRLRTELASTRLVIQRAEANGQSFSVNGTAVTNIAVDQAEKRAKRLERQIAALEARLVGGKPANGLAHTVTRIES